MKTILVTGIAGFLGSHCADHLMRAGHEVFGIDSLEGGDEVNVPDGSRFINMNICDEVAVKRLFGHVHFDAVVHCAAFASENLSHNCRLHTYRSVVMGSANLVNAAVNNGVEVFVSMSSIAVYGDMPAPFREDDVLRPADPYGSAKLCMEHDLMAAHDFFGLNYVVFRPHNIIGTRQNLADSTRNVASIFIRQALTGQPLTVFGDGLQTRAFSPVSHVARIIAACVDRPETWNNTYNVGGDRALQVLELANMVCELAEVRKEITHLPERKETREAHSLHHRVKAAFPDILSEEAIEVCLWSMIHEARKIILPKIKALPTIEIQQNLNPAWKC